ncbi:MAG: nickel pincer cofactor biosynthesis protein LarC [Bacillota bacterium]
MIGYLDLPSGISGDMFLGCLVDAGWPIDELRRTLERLKLPAGSWSVEAKSVMKGALRATLVDVHVAEGSEADHHHEHTSKEHPSHHHAHDHAHPDHSHEDHDHGHDHSHAHQPAEHPHGHRNLHDVRAIIEAADLPEGVKTGAMAVFTRLAEAEAKVHGSTIEQVHFHEVGALDAIVDIVGTVAGIHGLGIDRLYASPVPMGSGWVQTAHGQLPLPAPATLELLAAAKAPTRPAPGPGELVTPTGAALLGALATFEQPPMRIERIALGAGQRESSWPNVARLWLGTAMADAEPSSAKRGQFVQIETNIDDMNPQLYSAISDRLFAAGARDVWLTPMQMKKGRPGVTLSVLADAEHERLLADLILAETTTLGVRVRPVHRYEARREMRAVETAFGSIPVKLKWVGDKLCGAMPEYEDCRRCAESRQVPVRIVYEAAMAAAYVGLQRNEDRPR